MVTGLNMSLTYDSANRLTSAGSNNYTYDIKNIRAKNLCGDNEIEYTYNTNAKLSQLLYTEDENGNVTKYIYGNGLIGELNDNGAKVYHFDYRGSTTAVTDEDGNITDTFKYDTYGKLISRTGTSNVIFLYNGRDGVITDSNGLLYMRARYYSPDLKRFVNADILIGEITNPVTLNRYAYANGNPVSNIDPFGLSAERGWTASDTGHTLLDAGGLIPGFGMLFDGANTIWYLFEGDWGNAGFSALAFVPVIGDIAGVGKTGYKGVKISAKIIDGVDDVKNASKALETAIDVGNNLPPQKVIGHFPEYIDLSKKMGAKPFTIPDEIWKKMTPDEQWIANKKFLDRAIAKGSEFNIATPLEKIRPNSYLQKEISYLLEQGYKFDANGSKLIK